MQLVGIGERRHTSRMGGSGQRRGEPFGDGDAVQRRPREDGGLVAASMAVATDSRGLKARREPMVAGIRWLMPRQEPMAAGSGGLRPRWGLVVAGSSGLRSCLGLVAGGGDGWDRAGGCWQPDPVVQATAGAGGSGGSGEEEG